MILPKLLEDKRYEWQKITQEEILSNLLCKSHQFKALGNNSDKLIMVFGKSHAGKTTFILSFMGVAEEKLIELNSILRAGVPDGKSSTSTAIIYQKSDDDYFGYCEHALNDVSSNKVIKCSKDDFVEKIRQTRLDAESKYRDDEQVLFLHIPKFYFDAGEDMRPPVSILDVPGYETTNAEERYHTEAILNRYMSISVLNIVVRSINDINDLRYFTAPNRDNYTNLLSGKYIIVATRTYSQESVFKYFLVPHDKRTCSFEEMLYEECRKQFEEIFDHRIPRFFPIDVGDSFNELLTNKITDSRDRDCLILLRKKIYNEIYEYIESKQSNSLISWVQEVIEDEEYYSKTEKKQLNIKLEDNNSAIRTLESRLETEQKNEESLKNIINTLVEHKEGLESSRNNLCIPNIKELVSSEVNALKNTYFYDNYKWRELAIKPNVSDLFADIFSGIVKKVIENISEKYDFVDKDILVKWNNKRESEEITLREFLHSIMYAHKILKALNPDNKKKIELGQIFVQGKIEALIKGFYEELEGFHDEEMYKIGKQLNEFEMLYEQNSKEQIDIMFKISKKKVKKIKLEEQEDAIEKRVSKDKETILEYLNVARKNYENQRREVIDMMNASMSSSEKMEYLLFLGLLEKDFRKILI